MCHCEFLCEIWHACPVQYLARVHHVHCILIKLNIPIKLNTHLEWGRCKSYMLIKLDQLCACIRYYVFNIFFISNSINYENLWGQNPIIIVILQWIKYNRQFFTENICYHITCMSICNLSYNTFCSIWIIKVQFNLLVRMNISR